LGALSEPAAALWGVRPACDAVLVCDGAGQSALEIGNALIRAGAEPPVILLSRAADAATFRAALALGARGLLALPPDPHELRAAVLDASAARAERGAATRQSGRAVVICAAKGGSGASSVALSLAVAALGMLVALARGCAA